MAHKTFEQTRLDEEFVSYGRTVTETDIVNFTHLAGLKLPIFIDAEFCRTNSPFGQRICPGILLQAFAAAMMEELIGPYTIAALGFGESKFQRPVFIGDTIRTHSRIAAKRVTSNPDRGIVDIAVRIVNQRQETIMEGTYRLMMKVGA